MRVVGKYVLELVALTALIFSAYATILFPKNISEREASISATSVESPTINSVLYSSKEHEQDVLSNLSAAHFLPKAEQWSKEIDDIVNDGHDHKEILSNFDEEENVQQMSSSDEASHIPLDNTHSKDSPNTSHEVFADQPRNTAPRDNLHLSTASSTPSSRPFKARSPLPPAHNASLGPLDTPANATSDASAGKVTMLIAEYVPVIIGCLLVPIYMIRTLITTPLGVSPVHYHADEDADEHILEDTQATASTHPTTKARFRSAKKPTVTAVQRRAPAPVAVLSLPLLWLEGLSYGLVIVTGLLYIVRLTVNVTQAQDYLLQTLFLASYIGTLWTFGLYSLLYVMAAITDARDRSANVAVHHEPTSSNASVSFRASTSYESPLSSRLGDDVESNNRRTLISSSMRSNSSFMSCCSIPLIVFVFVLLFIGALIISQRFISYLIESLWSIPAQKRHSVWLLPFSWTTLQSLGVQNFLYVLAIHAIAVGALQLILILSFVCCRDRRRTILSDILLKQQQRSRMRQSAFLFSLTLYHLGLLAVLVLYRYTGTDTVHLFTLDTVLKHAFSGMTPALLLFQRLLNRISRCRPRAQSLNRSSSSAADVDADVDTTTGKDSKEESNESREDIPLEMHPVLKPLLDIWLKEIEEENAVRMSKQNECKQNNQLYEHSEPFDDFVFFAASRVTYEMRTANIVPGPPQPVKAPRRFFSFLAPSAPSAEKLSDFHREELDDIKESLKPFQLQHHLYRDDPWTLKSIDIETVLNDKPPRSTASRALIILIANRARQAVEADADYWTSSWDIRAKVWADKCRDLETIRLGLFTPANIERQHMYCDDWNIADLAVRYAHDMLRKAAYKNTGQPMQSDPLQPALDQMMLKIIEFTIDYAQASSEGFCRPVTGFPFCPEDVLINANRFLDATMHCIKSVSRGHPGNPESPDVVFMATDQLTRAVKAAATAANVVLQNKRMTHIYVLLEEDLQVFRKQICDPMLAFICEPHDDYYLLEQRPLEKHKILFSRALFELLALLCKTSWDAEQTAASYHNDDPVLSWKPACDAAVNRVVIELTNILAGMASVLTLYYAVLPFQQIDYSKFQVDSTIKDWLEQRTLLAAMTPELEQTLLVKYRSIRNLSVHSFSPSLPLLRKLRHDAQKQAEHAMVLPWLLCRMARESNVLGYDVKMNSGIGGQPIRKSPQWINDKILRLVTTAVEVRAYPSKQLRQEQYGLVEAVSLMTRTTDRGVQMAARALALMRTEVLCKKRVEERNPIVDLCKPMKRITDKLMDHLQKTFAELKGVNGKHPLLFAGDVLAELRQQTLQFMEQQLWERKGNPVDEFLQDVWNGWKQTQAKIEEEVREEVPSDGILKPLSPTMRHLLQVEQRCLMIAHRAIGQLKEIAENTRQIDARADAAERQSPEMTAKVALWIAKQLHAFRDMHDKEEHLIIKDPEECSMAVRTLFNKVVQLVEAAFEDEGMMLNRVKEVKPVEDEDAEQDDGHEVPSELNQGTCERLFKKAENCSNNLLRCTNEKTTLSYSYFEDCLYHIASRLNADSIPKDVNDAQNTFIEKIQFLARQSNANCVPETVLLAERRLLYRPINQSDCVSELLKWVTRSSHCAEEFDRYVCSKMTPHSRDLMTQEARQLRMMSWLALSKATVRITMCAAVQRILEWSPVTEGEQLLLRAVTPFARDVQIAEKFAMAVTASKESYKAMASADDMNQKDRKPLFDAELLRLIMDVCDKWSEDDPNKEKALQHWNTVSEWNKTLTSDERQHFVLDHEGLEKEALSLNHQYIIWRDAWIATKEFGQQWDDMMRNCEMIMATHFVEKSTATWFQLTTKPLILSQEERENLSSWNERLGTETIALRNILSHHCLNRQTDFDESLLHGLSGLNSEISQALTLPQDGSPGLSVMSPALPMSAFGPRAAMNSKYPSPLSINHSLSPPISSFSSSSSPPSLPVRKIEPVPDPEKKSDDDEPVSV